MWHVWRQRRRQPDSEIAPDEIFLDASNLPAYNTEQFEGRMERPIGRQALFLFGGLVVALLVLYSGRAFDLMFIRGVAYANQAAQNQLYEELIFADRGALLDRTGRELAYNVRAASTTEADYALRAYSTYRGISHVVGYVKPPARDSSGAYYRSAYVGIDGVEGVFDAQLAGHNGRVLTETDARGTVVSQSAERPPIAGTTLTLSIDAKVSEGLYDAVAARAQTSGFQGGAGVIINVNTGELLALTSYPEYSSQALAEGSSTVLAVLNQNPRKPFLDRAVNGLYAPGSIVKPFVATAALTEGVIDEHAKILSTGSISVPNPYDPEQPTIFRDWRAHGWVDMREALAVSSDVYFYEIGGGFENQPGLGIARLERWFRTFGFGEDPALLGFSHQEGTIPSPEWKAATFPGDAWRLGNTYHTAIGQYGMQVTPLQAARATAALVNGGRLLKPTLLASSTVTWQSIFTPTSAMQVVREGMRLGVTSGIAGAVYVPFVAVGAKTGTAEVGLHNEFINSWLIGFFPYEHPRYAFAVVLERAPAGTALGAPAAMSDFLYWLHNSAPQYLE